MKKPKTIIMGQDSTNQSLGSFKKLIEIAKKIDLSDSIEAIKAGAETIKAFREDDKEEFKSVYRKRHWKRKGR